MAFGSERRQDAILDAQYCGQVLLDQVLSVHVALMYFLADVKFVAVSNSLQSPEAAHAALLLQHMLSPSPKVHGTSSLT